MAKHEMELDDEVHRTIVLGAELGDDSFSVRVTPARLPTGEKVNIIHLKSLGPKSPFEEIKIISKMIKIPPDLLELPDFPVLPVQQL